MNDNISEGWGDHGSCQGGIDPGLSLGGIGRIQGMISFMIAGTISHTYEVINVGY